MRSFELEVKLFYLYLSRDGRDGKDLTVWCSNDYLGMSAHPAVKAAVNLVIYLSI